MVTRDPEPNRLWRTGRQAARWLLFACMVTLAALPATADTFKMGSPGKGLGTIQGKWQFHPGDDLSWAQPAYDDSGWEQLSGDTTWGAQGHPSYTGFAWYRKRIEITGAAQPLAILIPPVDDAYDLYWNGQKIGAYGQVPPHAYWWASGHSAVYPLGDAPLSGVLALRVWKSTLASLAPDNLGGLEAAPSIGDASVLEMKAWMPRSKDEQHLLPRVLIGTVILLAGLLALLLFLRDRRQQVYLWLGIYLFSDGLTGLERVDAFRYGMFYTSQQLFIQLQSVFQDISLWLLLLTLFGLTNDPVWRRWTKNLAVIYFLAQATDVIVLLFWQYAGPGMQWADGITTAVYSLTPIFTFFIVGFGIARKKQPALLPVGAAAFIYGFFGFVTGLVSQGPRFTHWTIAQKMLGWSITLGGYGFGVNFLLDLLLFLVLLLTVAWQQVLERRRQAEIEMEVRSAREVQHVLIPEEVAVIPGFAIASVYKPAAELGGDFFQVLAQNDGSVLLVLGDVSGKGLKAAMTVSFIVGALRSIIHYTRQPAEILGSLNQRLLGRSEGGFTTCLLLHIAAAGEVRLANAGHLAPFRDGHELPVAGSLPLGLSAETIYDELAFRLQEGETLTLYTDGILEARNPKGELYGFDRLTALLGGKPSVEEIVETACRFGQQDDITVLSIVRNAASQGLTARLNLTTQIAAI